MLDSLFVIFLLFLIRLQDIIYMWQLLHGEPIGYVNSFRSLANNPKGTRIKRQLYSLFDYI
jgi:hypothetical protein